MTPATAPTGSCVPGGHQRFLALFVSIPTLSLRDKDGASGSYSGSKKQFSISFRGFARSMEATSMGWSQQALASAAVRDSQSVVRFDCAGVVSGFAGDRADWVPAYCSAPATL
jgi:hypothetical protein